MFSIICLALIVLGLLAELAPEPAPPAYRATARQRRAWRRGWPDISRVVTWRL